VAGQCKPRVNVLGFAVQIERLGFNKSRQVIGQWQGFPSNGKYRWKNRNVRQPVTTSYLPAHCHLDGDVAIASLLGDGEVDSHRVWINGQLVDHLTVASNTRNGRAL